MTARAIAEQAAASGIEPGGVVLVHSSLSSLGQVPGGAETVIDGLLEAVGAEGTLLMPALSYEHVTPQQPEFDICLTPSNVGAITEAFRKRHGVMRSAHPTHSVCGIGPHARELLADHHLDDTPGGVNSPFRRLRDIGGSILFLGCGMRPNTSMHSVEEEIEAPYLFGTTVHYTIRLADGSRIEKPGRRHGHFSQYYERLAELLRPGGLSTGKILEANVQLVQCRAMWTAALAKLHANPLYFIQPEAPSEH